MPEKFKHAQIEGVEDNARKFLVGEIPHSFLTANNATSFTLVVDWLKIDTDAEKKIVYKKLEDGTIQIILISKITKDGNRISNKEEITEEEYQQLLLLSLCHLEKRRYEFKITQNGIPFSIKYDKFAGGKLYMLEVDASTETERDSFNPNEFENKLTEVTSDARYSGYRVTEMLQEFST